jgi:hypothetical protein
VEQKPEVKPDQGAAFLASFFFQVPEGFPIMAWYLSFGEEKAEGAEDIHDKSGAPPRTLSQP